MYYLFEPIKNAFGDVTEYYLTRYTDQTKIPRHLGSESYAIATGGYDLSIYYKNAVNKEGFIRIDESELPPKIRAMVLLLT